MLTMMEIRERWRWQEGVISAGSWGSKPLCGGGGAVPSQGKVSSTRLPTTLLCTAGAHCTWQVSFVEASGEFRTNLKYLPGRSVVEKSYQSCWKESNIYSTTVLKYPPEIKKKY